MISKKWKGNLEIAYFNLVPNHYICPTLQWSTTLTEYFQMREIHYFKTQPHMKKKKKTAWKGLVFRKLSYKSSPWYF